MANFSISKIKFGVEIEVTSRSVNKVEHILRSAQKDKRIPEWFEFEVDGEHCGTEIIPPPLTGQKGLQTLEQIYDVCKKNFNVNAKCGSHIHIDCQRMGLHDDNLNGFKQLAKMNFLFQNGIYRFVHPSRQYGEYAHSLMKKELQLLLDADNLDDLCYMFDSKYYGINFQSYIDYGTVEFRYPQGCLEFKHMFAYIVTFAKMVWVASHYDVDIPQPDTNTISCIKNLIQILELQNETYNPLKGRELNAGRILLALARQFKPHKSSQNFESCKICHKRIRTNQSCHGICYGCSKYNKNNIIKCWMCKQEYMSNVFVECTNCKGKIHVPFIG
jgi:hypothetical protein